jgi:RNA polymerase sigma-70 factor (ECF subfamily)
MTAERDALVTRVREACERTDAPALAALLHPGVVALIDSGGDLIAETLPVTGADRVIPELLGAVAGAGVTVQAVNGVDGLVVRRGIRVVAIVAFDVADYRVTRVWITLNPLKLRRWNS